jgi:HEAT repeat protein
MNVTHAGCGILSIICVSTLMMLTSHFKTPLEFTADIKALSIQDKLTLAQEISSHQEGYDKVSINTLLNDDFTHIRYATIEAVSQAKLRQYIPQFLTLLEESNDHYEQFYLYRALMRLGWKNSFEPTRESRDKFAGIAAEE